MKEAAVPAEAKTAVMWAGEVRAGAVRAVATVAVERGGGDGCATSSAL